MEKVIVSVNALYIKFGEELENGVIEKTVDENGEYFDLYEGGLVCMDGETCTVEHRGEDKVILKNSDGEVDTLFTLSNEEFKYGCSKIR